MSRKNWKAFEHYVVKKFKRWWPDARRGFIQFRECDKNTPDVMGTPFFIECKNYSKRLPNSVTRLWEDANKRSVEYEKDTGEELIPIVVWNVDGGKVKVAGMVGMLEKMGVYVSEESSAFDVVSVSWKAFAAALDEYYDIADEPSGGRASEDRKG